MKTIVLTCCLLPFITLLGCGGSTGIQPAPALECAPALTVAVARDLNYPGQDCTQATARAEAQLGSLHYRKACQAAADPGAALSPSVAAARVTDCRTTEGRGVFLDVEICCPEAVEQAAEQALEPESVVRAAGPRCPSWRTRALASNLHYPGAESCDAILAQAEAALGSFHYSKACKAAVPRATRKAKVLEARVVECRSGGSSIGVNVDVELCCDAKVFEESDFRELVWRRAPEEVRAALGEPRRITEQAPGVYWNYAADVAREERVFPEVTLVFVDGRVDSYYF